MKSNMEVKMSEDLKLEADLRYEEFVETCSVHGFRDKWEFYRADEAGEDHPEVKQAHDDYIEALHRFYKARDGEKGFLGSRGL